MTIILEIAPETESRLRDKATAQGLDLPAYLLELAERDAYEEVEESDPDADLTEEDKAAIREGIRRGLQAFEEGRYRSLEAVIAEKRERWDLDI